MSISIVTADGTYTSPLRKVVTPSGLMHFAWDDENPDFDFKCRTQQSDWIGVAAPPAVIRYYPVMVADAGEFRVNISAWWSTVVDLNHGDESKAYYWSGKARAQFNRTGWPLFMNVGMCGNTVNVLEFIGEWAKIETLKVTDVSRVKAERMSRKTHSHLIHTFTCVGWIDGKTKRIASTNTNKGIVDYPFVTEQGFAFIQKRYLAPGVSIEAPQ